MGTIAKILGKVKPNAAENTVLYVVPALTEAVVNLKIANQSATESAIRVAFVSSGAALAATDYVLYGYSLLGNQSLDISGIALAAGDFIVVYSANATVSFVATGLETT